jgi:hypothetical protein
MTSYEGFFDELVVSHWKGEKLKSDFRSSVASMF